MFGESESRPMDYTVHGILSARLLEWVAFPFSRGSSQPRGWIQVSHTAGRFFTSWATREAQNASVCMNTGVGSVGEDSWESLGMQGDPTSPSWRKSVLNIPWKDGCWSWNSNTLAMWCEEPTHLRRPWSGKDWRQEEKGTTEDEMIGWHRQHDGHEFE